MLTTGPMVSLAPIYIQPLLEIYCMVLIKDMPHWSRLSGSGCGSISFELLFDERLIQDKKPKPADPDRCGFELTERGRVYLEALIGTHLPTEQWVIL